jgi:hypothetical protein
MFGYVLGALVALVFLVLFIGGMARGGPASGRDRQRADRPVQAETPAADEPTPDRSATASRREIETARHHTPPA